jgi:hypothetical protein
MPLLESVRSVLGKEEFVRQSFQPKHLSRHDEVYVGLFFGAITFYLVLWLTVWLGFASGILELQLSFNESPPHQHLGWREIAYLILSFALAFLSARNVFGFIRTHGKRNSTRQADKRNS